MIENLHFHIVFKRSKPGNSLIINWIMKADKFFIFWSFNLIVKRREMEQNRFDTMESICFPRSKRSKIMQWLQLFECPYLNQLCLSLRFQTCDAGVFLPSPRCSEMTFLGAVTASLVPVPKCWHNRRICSLILGRIYHLKPTTSSPCHRMTSGQWYTIWQNKTNTTATEHRDGGATALKRPALFYRSVKAHGRTAKEKEEGRHPSRQEAGKVMLSQYQKQPQKKHPHWSSVLVAQAYY